MSDREFLLKEEQEVGRNHYPECPETICKISNLLVRALIDTGSEVTCVSSMFVDNCQLRNCPRLPVKHRNVPVSYTHLLRSPLVSVKQVIFKSIGFYMKQMMNICH